MSQTLKLNIQYSYFYPDPKYLEKLYATSDPVTYKDFKEFELLEQYTNYFIALGDLQGFITKTTGIPAAQQRLMKADSTLITGSPDTLLSALGLKDNDVVTLETFRASGPFDYSTVKTEDQKKAFVATYPPPAYLNDLDTIDKQVKWAEWESNTADQNIYTGAGPFPGFDGYVAYPIASQFFNPANPPTPVGPVSVTKIIAWNGLPGLLRDRMPYTEVYEQADKVIKYGERTNQTEYCEWKTFYADEAKTKISKVVFTCEGPEYWQQLFNIDPEKCVSLYRELTGIQSITRNDLIAKEDIYLEGMPPPPALPFVHKGQYNFYNDYNTTKGIVHLNQRNNYLSAELNIASMSTQLQQQADPQGNLTVLQKALPLVLAGEYGSPGRNSDPTIGFICNWVARHPLGLRLTIAPPVALYFGLLNTTGWSVPDGTGDVSDWVKCVRGKPELGQALRYEIAPPKSAEGRYYVNDMTIGGQPIKYGGQIARCMTVQLTGVAAAFPADTPTIAPPVRPRQAIAASFGLVDPISQNPVSSVTLAETRVQSKKPAHKHHPKRTPYKPSMLIEKIVQENALPNNNPPADSPEEAYQKMTAVERETILDIDDIQGDPLFGFNTSNSIILLLDIKDVMLTKKWLQDVVSPKITSTRQVIKRHEHMNTYRQHQKLGITDTPYSIHPQYTYLNISFSSEGLGMLTSSSEVNKFYAMGNSEAFVMGMPKRSTLLGDPDANSKELGSRGLWKFGGERTPHIMIQIQGDTMDDCEYLAKNLLDTSEKAVDLVHRDIGKRREGPLQKPKEQFGFHDGISNPAVRGMYEVEDPLHAHKLAYISKREIDKTDMRWNFYSKPGTSLIWPGELILGYKKQRNVSGDRPAPPPQYYWLPDDDSFIGPDWAKNGTFVIYRRLNQNVASFWNHAKETAEAFNEQFAKQAAPNDWDALKAASRFIGRWPSGCPIMLSPEKDVEVWGQDKTTQNSFMYAVDTPPFPSAQTGEPVEGVPTIPSDNIALRCPVGSHVRKINPRDQGTDFGPDEDTLKHRIMRRGTPFGPFVPEEDKFKDDGKDRGLQFIAYVASIDMQFEFLLRFWANFDQQPLAMTAGHANDMVIGQPAQTDYERQITAIALNKDGLPAVGTSPKTKDRWVYATGGGYFFMPGISAILNKLCQ